MSVTQDFLLEIGTEELPPKHLAGIIAALASNIEQGLNHAALTFGKIKSYVTPRRLAILVTQLLGKQSEQAIEMRGPSVDIAFDASGVPTAAARKFAATCGVEVSQLEKHEDKKGVRLIYKTTKHGLTVAELLPNIVQQALKNLPTPRTMRWGDGDITFIRPVHWVVMLYGQEVIPAIILGQKTDKQTFGHRFLHPEAIVIDDPRNYAELLEKTGYVIADFQRRQEIIRQQILGANKEGTVLLDEDLLDEVTGLVEWPVTLSGTFDASFLEVPQEVVISALQHQQRYFPVVDETGKLLPRFIVVSNIQSQDPQQVINGNERVICARLTDAQYFYRTDLAFTLDSYVDKLAQRVFQEKLGTTYDKVIRLGKLTTYIARALGADEAYAGRAAQICKSDLLSTLVGEFPDLQGIMGYYYALQQFEPEPIAIAIKEQYLPRYAKDKIPDTLIGCALALADRIDTLVGMFGTNLQPTGEKDPMALRRAAHGIIRIILEKTLVLDVQDLLQQAMNNYAVTFENTAVVNQVMDFIYERMRSWYAEQGGDAKVFNAVLERRPTKLLDFKLRLLAVTEFKKLPAAVELTSAHKRVRNILSKAQLPAKLKFNLKLAKEEAEKNLAEQLQQKIEVVNKFTLQNNYQDALKILADLKPAIDLFFDKIMVMDKNEKLRNNRLALLVNLRDLFSSVADISLL